MLRKKKQTKIKPKNRFRVLKWNKTALRDNNRKIKAFVSFKLIIDHTKKRAERVLLCEISPQFDSKFSDCIVGRLSLSDMKKFIESAEMIFPIPEVYWRKSKVNLEDKEYWKKVKKRYEKRLKEEEADD